VHLVKKGEISGASLCSMKLQYPKFHFISTTKSTHTTKLSIMLGTQYECPAGARHSRGRSFERPRSGSVRERIGPNLELHGRSISPKAGLARCSRLFIH
jgi:hypothetical protein